MLYLFQFYPHSFDFFSFQHNPPIKRFWLPSHLFLIFIFTLILLIIFLNFISFCVIDFFSLFHPSDLLGIEFRDFFYGVFSLRTQVTSFEMLIHVDILFLAYIFFISLFDIFFQ